MMKVHGTFTTATGWNSSKKWSNVGFPSVDFITKISVNLVKPMCQSAVFKISNLTDIFKKISQNCRQFLPHFTRIFYV